MTVSGTLGGITGGPKQLRWKYYDPKDAPKIGMWKPWSKDRNYCGEKLPWNEETWTLPPETDDFQCNSRAFYNNLYDVLVNRGKLAVTLEQVRRQVYVLEECHRQNPLPRLARKQQQARGKRQ